MDKKTLLGGWKSAAEKVSEIGGAVTSGAQRLKENIADDYSKFKEIGAIKEEGQRLLQEAETSLRAAEGRLHYEHDKVQSLTEKLEQGLLKTYAEFCRYLQVSSANEANSEVLPVPPELKQANLWQEAGTAGMQAVAAGAAAGAATVGLVTAVGTAGTGTALSALSGAAYVNATLAALGGGSVAAGGLGMAGGVAVLGAAVAAPAALVMGYFFDKKINVNHAEAVKWLSEVRDYAEKVRESVQRAEVLSFRLREKAQEIYAFQHFFRDMLNVSAGAVAWGDTRSYLPILNDGATTLIACMQLPVTRGQAPNPDYDALMSELRSVIEACRREFYAYVLELPRQRRLLLNSLREQDLSEHREDFAQWVEIIAQNLKRMEEKLDNVQQEMQEGFERVEAGLLDVRSSLSVLGDDLRRMQEETGLRLREAAGNAEETEIILNNLTDSMSKRLLEVSALQQKRSCAEQEIQLREAFGESWGKLAPQSRKFLISARMLYLELSGMGDRLDFSGVCILAVKALENELHRRLYSDFVKYLQEKYPAEEELGRWPSSLRRRDRWGREFVLPEARFTLGTVPFVCGTRTASYLSDAEHEADLRVVAEYAKEQLLAPGMTGEEIWTTLQAIGTDTDRITQKYRNPAAHINALGQGEAKACLDFLLEVERAFIWMMTRFAA